MIYWKYLSQNCVVQQAPKPQDISPVALHYAGMYFFYTLDFPKVARFITSDMFEKAVSEEEEEKMMKKKKAHMKSCGDLDGDNHSEEDVSDEAVRLPLQQHRKYTVGDGGGELKRKDVRVQTATQQ